MGQATLSPRAPSVRAAILARRTYNRPLNEDGTLFETWPETIQRVRAHQVWLWERAQGGSLSQKQQAEMDELTELMLNRMVAPAGRTLWLGGTELVKRREASNFNCSFIEVRTVHDVVDVFWLLLQGCGVGFKPINGALSGFTRKMEIELIRSTRKDRGRDTNEEHYDPATKTWTISIGDSAEAWAKAIGKLVAGKFPARKLVLDLRQIRPAGTRLKGYGWICSGDSALAIALEAICGIMNKQAGKLLSKIDILDIVNWLGTVLSSRRSAQIALVDYGDPEWYAFATAKAPKTLKEKWHRGQSNNSLVFYEPPTKRQMKDLFEMIVEHGGAEPGFVNAIAAQARAPWFKGLNPCGEILLANYGFCVSGDTLLITRTGITRIEDAVGRRIEVWNGKQWSEVVPKVTGKDQKLLRVSFNDGSYLDCTPYHRFSVKTRFDESYREVMAKDLMNVGGQYQVHTEPFTIQHDQGEDHPEAYTLGIAVGDACTPINGLETLDAELVLTLKSAADGFEKLFSWSRKSILDFVAGLADADGSETGAGGIRICIATFERARRLQLLLTKCGIRSSVNLLQEKDEGTNYGPQSQDIFYLQITNCAELPCHRLKVSKGHESADKDKWQIVKSVVELPGRHAVYCFNEPHEHKAVFGNTLTFQCNLVELDVARWRGDHLGMHRALRLIARANYRQTMVNLRDGILQDAWHQTNEFLRLCGVGLTGIVRRPDLTPYDFRQMRYTAIAGAYEMADELGAERPKNVTTIKPSGTLSKAVFDTTEGAHKPKAKYIFNNVIFSRHDRNVERLLNAGYYIFDHPNDKSAVLVRIPVCYDDVQFDVYNGHEVDRESAIVQLERYKMLQHNYVDQNTSITISYEPSETKAMIDWYLKNWDSYVATSFLFRADVTKTAKDLGFTYLPQEVVTKKAYDDYVSRLLPVDFDSDGSVDSPLEEECVGGACPIR